MKVKSECCGFIQEYDEKDPDTMLCGKCHTGNRFNVLLDLPEKKYNTIVIDPPWDISMAGKMKFHTTKEKLPYKTMSLQEIKNIPLGDIANTGCHVYCWTTNKMLKNTFDVLESWGVNFHLCLVWAKNSGIAPCLGYVFATEFCLMGFYGKPMQKFTKMGKVNWLNLKQNSGGKHSSKPQEWYDLIEQMSPAPRIDIFARKKRENWDVFGDEIPTGCENTKSEVSGNSSQP